MAIGTCTASRAATSLSASEAATAEVPDRLPLDERQQVVEPATGLVGARSRGRGRRSRRNPTRRLGRRPWVIVVELSPPRPSCRDVARQTGLLRRAASRAACTAGRSQGDPKEHADDRDHDQQFDQRERAAGEQLGPRGRPGAGRRSAKADSIRRRPARVASPRRELYARAGRGQRGCRTAYTEPATPLRERSSPTGGGRSCPCGCSRLSG